MQSIYGYKDSETLELIKYLKENKGNGKSLSQIFSEFAKLKGKSKGTIRNMYYAIVKKSNEDIEFRQEVLDGQKLKVSKIEEFGDEEERTLIKSILLGQRAGRSCRSVILELSGNDSKKALRYQNKYRNVLANKPRLVRALVEEIRQECGDSYDPYAQKQNKIKISEIQFRRLASEINGLVDRISNKIKAENEILKERLNQLENENLRLRNLLYGSGGKTEIFFKNNKVNKKIIN